MSRKSEFVLEVMQDYRILVKFDGLSPDFVPGPGEDAGRETFAKFCRRVLERKPSEVEVFLGRKVAPQTRIGSLENKGAVIAFRALMKDELKKARTRGFEDAAKQRAAEEAGKLKALSRVEKLEDDARRLRGLLQVAEGRAAKAAEDAAEATRDARAETAPRLCALLEREVGHYLRLNGQALDEIAYEQLQSFRNKVKDCGDLQDSLGVLFGYVNFLRKEQVKNSGRIEQLAGDNRHLFDNQRSG